MYAVSMHMERASINVLLVDSSVVCLNRLFKLYVTTKNVISHTTDDDLQRGCITFHSLWQRGLFSCCLGRNCFLCLLRWIPPRMIVKKIVNVARKAWFSRTDITTGIMLTDVLSYKSHHCSWLKSVRVNLYCEKTSNLGIYFCDLVLKTSLLLSERKTCYTLETKIRKRRSLHQNWDKLSLIKLEQISFHCF